MWLTYRLSDQRPGTPQAGSTAPFFFKYLNAHGASSLGRDLNGILLDLSREGPFGLFRAWCKRWRYRRELARLLIIGPYMISDIGMTHDQAVAEMDRPFWRR